MTDGRSRRLLDVTADTTLDFAAARVVAHDWKQDAVAVVDVDEREDPTTETPTDVELSVEVDGTDVDRLPQHATHLDLSPADARALADDLVTAAATVEDATGTTADGETEATGNDETDAAVEGES